MLESRSPATEDLPAVADQLDELRRAVDASDDELVRLLSERAGVVSRIGALKSASASPAYSPDRERVILDRVAAQNPGPLSAAHIRDIFREIISACRSLEEPERVVFLGPAYTFSHEAARAHFGRSAGYLPAESFREVFAHVERGDAAYGLVPVENSTSGTIGETLDLFSEHDVAICGEVVVPISHNLIATTIEDTYTTVFSHAQALHQCRDWLARQLPAATRHEVASTSEAAQRASGQPGTAAIGTVAAAEAYRLTVVRRHIQDLAANRTRFYVIARRPASRTGRDRTALLVSIRDRVGALHDMLGMLRSHDVNLNFIQSRPSRIKPGDYLFFLELTGHPDDPNVGEALAELARTSVLARVLGAWPVNPAPD